MKFVRIVLDNSIFVNLIALLILILGVISATHLRREAFPIVDFDIVLVQTYYPGASPREVEQFITDPIEDQLKTVSDVKRMNSSSIEGMSVVTLEIDPDAKDKKKVVDDIKTAVEKVQDLPDEILDRPLVRELATRDSPVIEVSLSGLPYDQLRQIAEDLEDRFLDLPDASSIVLNGFRDREILVTVKPDRLRRDVVSLAQVAQRIDASNRNVPAGAIRTQGEEFLVRSVGAVEQADEVARIVLRANDVGDVLTVGDVAEVEEGYAELTKLYRTNSKDSINLVVIKRETGDIIDLVADVKKSTSEYKDSRGLTGLDINYLNDFSYYVQRRLNVLSNNAKFGIVLVLLCLVFFLSPGISAMTALGMPIAFGGALAGMMFLGATVNLISMMGLIIVLGMIVDDAIIVAENVFHHARLGADPREAVIRGTSEVVKPVAATILTTMAAFSPLMMMGGIMGKFIFVMPLVVLVALGISWFESMVILPAHLYDVLKWGNSWRAWREKGKAKKKKPGDTLVVKKVRESIVGKVVLGSYRFTMRMLLRVRYLVVIVAIGVTAFSVNFAKNNMKIVLFPASGVEIFLIKAKLPTSADLDTTSKMMGKIEPLIAALPVEELDSYTTMVGMVQNDPNDPFTARGSNFAQINVYLTPESKRSRTALEISEAIQEQIKPFASQFDQIEVTQMRGGPPQGKPVSVAIKGRNYEDILYVVNLVQEKLKTIAGVLAPANDYDAGKRELVVTVDERRAALAGVSVDSVPFQVRGAYEGLIATTVKRGDEEIDVRVRFSENQRNQLKSFDDILIPNSFGRLIPLKQIATVQIQPGVGALTHLDASRVVRVEAELDEAKITSLEAGTIIKSWVGELEKERPGVRVDVRGGYEDTQDSLKDLQQAFLVALFLIFMILAALFRKISLPFIIIAAIPFGLVGVIWAFYVHDLALSFLGLLGAIGLSGVVVNDSIVLVDYIERSRGKTLTGLMNLVVEGGARRILPVWLTSVTTVVGLLPVAYGWGGFDPFVMPIAIAIGWGLVVATLVTLILIPVFYTIRYTFFHDLAWLLAQPVRLFGRQGYKTPRWWDQPDTASQVSTGEG